MVIDRLLLPLLAALLVVTAGCTYRPTSSELSDEGSAARWLSAAQAGNGEAAFNVAVFYQSGNVGLPKDLSNAKYWFLRSAELGYAEAQCTVGAKYEDEDEDDNLFDRNLPAAKYWYEQCMLNDRAEGYYYLGRMYDTLGSLLVDTERAKYYYLRGVERGDPWSMNGLANLYAEGRNLPTDFRKAAELWERAAQSGASIGAYNLGRAYRDGRGVEADPVQALKWLQIAAAMAKWERSGMEADWLASRLDIKEIAQAKALKAEWLDMWRKENTGRKE